MAGTVPLSLTVNGEEVARMVAPRTTLADFLRTDLELTATHVGCEMGACGACLVLLDGVPVHSCLVFAVQAQGQSVETVEGLVASGALAPLQQAFHERNALQCGFCTPGMLVNAHALIARGGVPEREEIRDAISGNYCRCTGYEAIVDAIEVAARKANGEVAE
ncbi:(2Fe-2S)-binding protein [Xanthobacter flavus]|uniref:(2Fe-2S)-binding protein n=1 Tax=Xanthobacter flavus TaxID=281 RepID=UPI003726DE3B